MPYLYIFVIQNLICYPDDKYIAIISGTNQSELNELNEGDITGLFNHFKLQNDIIVSKKIIQIENNIFNEIITNYKDNIKIIEDNDYFWCEIDGKKIKMQDSPFPFPSTHSEIIYDYVGVYNFTK